MKTIRKLTKEQMTWNEFKAFVDKEIEKQGGTGDVTIEYIDISSPCKDHDMCIPYVVVEDELIIQ